MLSKFALVKGVDKGSTNFLKAILRQVVEKDPDVLNLGKRLKGVTWLSEKFKVSGQPTRSRHVRAFVSISA